MLTYQQIKDFLEKLTGLFSNVQKLHDAQVQVNLLSRDLAQNCALLRSEQNHMSAEIERTEKIGELIRQCVYEVTENSHPSAERPLRSEAIEDSLRRISRDEL